MVAPELLVDLLETQAELDDPPAWFEIHADAETKTMVVARHDELRDLFGWRMGAPFTAIGVVAGGQGRDLPGRAEIGPSWEGRRARLVVVVDRDGGVWSRTRLADGDVVDGGCQGGRLFDALRRALDLPTDPAPISSASMITSLWLTSIIDAGAAGAADLDWPAVLALHPASKVLADLGEDLPLDEANLVVTTAPRAWTWERLRGYTAAGGGLADLVAPDMAAWMDEGMFARWALEVGADPHELWGRAVPLLESDAVVRLAEAIDATGVEPPGVP